MNVFELFAKLSLDSSGFERGLNDAKGDARDAGKNIDKSLGDSAKSSEKKVNSLGETAKDSGKKLTGFGESAKDSSKQTAGLGDQIDGITKKLGIDVPDSAKEALNGMSGFSSGTVAAMGVAAGAIAAIYKSAKAMYDLTVEAAAYADELLTRSAKTDLSTDLLQGIDYASKFLDFEGLEQSLTRITNSMAAARDGAKEQSAAFEALGVSVTGLDGNLADNWETFKSVIDALGQVENATERDAIANDIFGRSFSELKPLIAAGSTELQGYIDELKTSGRMLSVDQVKALGAVDDAHQELTETIKATKNMLAVEFAPAAKSAMETFEKGVQKAGKALIDSAMIQTLGQIVTSVTGIMDAGLDLIDALPDWLNPIKNMTTELKGLAIVLATIADAVNVVAGLFTLDFNKVKTALGFNAKNGQYSNLQQLRNPGPKEPYQDYYDFDPKTYWTDTPHNASGTRNWKGGKTWVGENGPEMVELPAGSRIWNNSESRRLASATNIYNITVNGIEELDEVLRWFQGRQVEARMV